MAGLRIVWAWARSLSLSHPSTKIMSLPSFLAIFFAIYWLTKRNWSRRLDYSPTMSPDTVSSLFPDRPIRPLPKRRLRERLSPEVADSIKYPPSTVNAVPLFQYPPYTVKDESPPGTGPTSPTEQIRRHDPPRNYTPRRNGVGAGSGVGVDPTSRSSLVTRSSPEILNRTGGRSARSESRQANPQPPPSASSSVDGYESFENTNNKKKRKIPSAGDSTLNSAHALSPDTNSHSVQGGVPSMGELNGERPYHNGAGYAGPGSLGPNNTGMSGSGRGRLGRSRNGRSPLRALPDGNNTWAGRPPKGTPPHWAPSGTSKVFSFVLDILARVPIYPELPVASYGRRTSLFSSPSLPLPPTACVCAVCLIWAVAKLFASVGWFSVGLSL